MDVLAAGGSLTIDVSAGHSTSGSLSVPGSITGGAAFNASMTGTATVSGSTVKFNQSADTFVRDLTFTVAPNTLTANNQAAGSETYNVVLTRQ